MSDIEIGTTGWDALNELLTMDDVPSWAHKFVEAGMQEIDRLRAELDALRKQEQVCPNCYCSSCNPAPVATPAPVARDALERLNKKASYRADNVGSWASDEQIDAAIQRGHGTTAPVAQKVPDGFRIVPRDTFTRAICALAYAVNTYPDDPCGFDGAYNALSAVGPVITGDYALVPVELTEEMFEAADNVYDSPRSMWSAMLAAAQAQEGKP